MIRGIRFKIPNGYQCILGIITKNVNIEKYFWYDVESKDQVFNNNFEFFFDNTYYDGKTFSKLINSIDYYVIFIKLQAHNTDDMSEINSYGEFLKSNCEMMFFIVDGIFVDIYAKYKNIIETIKLNAQKNDFTEIEYITNENDGMAWDWQ